MMTLALEFSSPRRSVALFHLEHGSSRPAILATLSDAGEKSARPIPLIEQLLGKAGVKRESIEAIVIGLGPGSYTGIRSAIALAQGWQLARNIKTSGVSSAEALAVQAQALGYFGQVHIVIDAQRQEFYLTTYAISPEQRQMLTPLRLVDLQTVQATAAQGVVLGPEVAQWISSGKVVFPEAATLAQLADPFTLSVPGEELDPIYLRQPMFVKAPPPRRLPT